LWASHHGCVKRDGTKENVAVAVAAGAELIVTGDKPMLTVAEHQGVRIVGVSEAVKALAP
jgi:predicted nucleic acid-binding protein